ncbi:MAG: 3-deoxy-D-manno-octulosonic acid transferase, partial [Deltaproteobacteria bacterium]
MLRPLRIAAYGLKERFGLWDQRLREEVAKKAPFLWAHGASVGEVQLTLRLLEEFRSHIPWPILLTSMTPQGLGVARGKVDIALPFPIPLGLPIRTFLRRINPRAILIAETELWPPLLWEAERRGIPVVLFNARISDGSFKR